jgi:2-amino-4-hydroxy-6-hydroxymethyldihydropteridine diphosphokinase
MRAGGRAVLFCQQNNSIQTIQQNCAIIGIGSNINPEANISGMLKVLARKVHILKYSSFLKTKPVGIENQSDFINGAVKIETNLNRENLNHLLKSIEDRFKRDRSKPKFGPRTIDLDIVAWNDEIVDNDYFCREFLRQTVDEVRGTF